MNTDSKIFNKTLTKRIQTYIKKIIYHDQIGFIPEIQGWFKIQKSLNAINHINELKDKNHIIISIDTEKACDKIQHAFMMNVLQNVELEETGLNTIKHS